MSGWRQQGIATAVHCIHCCQIDLAFGVQDDLGLTPRYSRALREVATNGGVLGIFFGFPPVAYQNPGIATKHLE